MNNQQFRNLLINTSKPASSSSSSSHPQDASSSTPRANPSATPSLGLGSRARSSIPMTPRHVPGSSGSSASALFAQQLREAKGSQNGPKFKSSAAPKGSKLAAGYTDRAAQLRGSDGSEDDKVARVRALEEMVKLGQMEQADFERARDQITGGDVRHVHLVKGLDRRLLARARAGEDVFGESEDGKEEELGEESGEPPEDVDDRLDELERAEVKPVEREERVKQGVMAPPPAVAGKKRTRDDILREMKEARARAAAEQAAARQPVLGAHFKKIGPRNEPGTSRVEIDELGREVLIVVDEAGNVKRKVKKQKTGQQAAPLPMPDKDVKPLGMNVPEQVRPAVEEEESEDIFADAGDDYDPLGDIQDDDDSDSDSDASEDGETKDKLPAKRPRETDPAAGRDDEISSPAAEQTKSTNKPRNYFGSEMETAKETFDPISDPSILGALKRASASKAADSSSEQANDPDTEGARRARMQARLAAQDRDAEDMDMGFGSSRFDDQDDGEERKVKLSKWTGLGGGDDDDEGGEYGERGGKPRKRGKKKKKGDKNDASAVLGVLERRKA